jgi:sigma-B regulation protein RsbU (phosphoserine phosphatase)
LRDRFFQLTGQASTAIVIVIFLAGFVLGQASLILNALRNPSPEARRKSRVLVWGIVAGLTPFALLLAYSGLTDRAYYDLPYWVWTPGIIMVFLVPISFAYAVVKHRVLEIPMLLKRSARYLLAKGSFAVAMTAVAVLVPVNFANVAAQSLNFPTDAVVPFALLIGVVFGALWVVGAGEIEKRIMARIDRAFFRSVYDARRILQELAQTARTVCSREQLAALLQQHIREALLPRSLVVYFEDAEGLLRRHGSAGELPETLSTDAPLLKELAAHGRPWEVPAGEEWVPSGSFAVVNLPQLANLRALLDEQMTRPAPPAGHTDVIAALAPVAPECLVPLVGRDARLAGLLVLGGRLSEEPYSDEDERLLASVADQAAIALDNMRLAESMAEKIEAERKAADEIAIAREVQAKLFPQTHPPMATIEYTGLCDQARKVGGDYYDFLDLGPGRIGLALADISGKGIFAALLMANLQANLRSQYARALDDLPGLMRSVNRQFQQSTAIGLFATMFFADYSDQTRRLRYVNCGHNPPLVVRADRSCQRLEPTAPVIGLLENWECEVGEAELRPGDLLVVYSDGVTEAQSDAGDFFGEKRLQEAARHYAHLPIAEAARAIAKTVHTFSESEQEDDLTLLVARALPPR